MAYWWWLAFAGAVGVLGRAACTEVLQRLCGDTFPWGTMAVNLIGSLVSGLIVATMPWRGIVPAVFVPQHVEKILLVGLLGGFTTFSSFAFDALRLFEAGRPLAAVVFVAANNLGGLAAAWVGLRAGGG